jgi:hypothetical protein
MQHMPDKDFDKLFTDRFMDAEIEPSADLWGNIAGQLEPKKSNKPFPLMWVAAASVAVVASVMLFTQSEEKVYLRGAAVAVTKVAPVTKIQNVPVVATEEVKAETVTAVLPAPSIIKRSLLKKEVASVPTAQVEAIEKNNFVAVQPSAENDHLPIKKAEAMPLNVVTTPNEVNRERPEPTIYHVDAGKIREDVENMGDSDDNKKGIRNVGDLVNYVVDKVDKREKKLIKFGTDDDDNSSIIGLNIGFLKFNKKNK